MTLEDWAWVSAAVGVVFVACVLALMPACPCTRGEPCPGRSRRRRGLGAAPKIRGRIIPPQGGSGTATPKSLVSPRRVWE
jgi:hypothetical protein